jgi:hypothetical protein
MDNHNFRWVNELIINYIKTIIHHQYFEGLSAPIKLWREIGDGVAWFYYCFYQH